MLQLNKLFEITTEPRLIKYYIQSYETLMKRIFPACSQARGSRVDQTLTILDLKNGSMKMASKQVRTHPRAGLQFHLAGVQAWSRQLPGNSRKVALYPKLLGCSLWMLQWCSLESGQSSKCGWMRKPRTKSPSSAAATRKSCSNSYPNYLRL